MKEFINLDVPKLDLVQFAEEMQDNILKDRPSADFSIETLGIKDITGQDDQWKTYIKEVEKNNSPTVSSSPSWGRHNASTSKPKSYNQRTESDEDTQDKTFLESLMEHRAKSNRGINRGS